MMTPARKNSTQTPEDQLSEFTDRLLEGKADAPPALSADRELRALEETLVQLRDAFPREGLDRAAARRMHADFQQRVRREGRAAQPAWRSRQSRQRLTLLTVAVLLIVVLVISPFLNVDGGSILGTAGAQVPGVWLAVVLGAILMLAFWLVRRK